MDCSPTRLLCPWDFPGKNTGVGCYVPFQGIFWTQGSNLGPWNWQVDSLPLSHEGCEKQINISNAWHRVGTHLYLLPIPLFYVYHCFRFRKTKMSKILVSQELLNQQWQTTRNKNMLSCTCCDIQWWAKANGGPESGGISDSPQELVLPINPGSFCGVWILVNTGSGFPSWNN